MFFIASGTAQAVIYSADGKAVVFRNLTVGSMFGELAAIDGGERSAGIVAITPCTVAQLTAPEYRGLLVREPVKREIKATWRMLCLVWQDVLAR